MGELVWSPEGAVYLDANCFIYSVERIDPYCAILDILWQSVSTGQVKVVTSELTLLEVLVKPLKMKNALLVAIYRTVLQTTPDVQMLPITQSVLEEAARLRATTNLKTPDAIHAATASINGYTSFITNDEAFRRASHLAVTLLHEMVPIVNPENPDENVQ